MKIKGKKVNNKNMKLLHRLTCFIAIIINILYNFYMEI